MKFFILKIVLDKRLDNRVDQMIQAGLVDELNNFKTEFEETKRESGFSTIKEYSRDFQFGIFQSIGFKEFNDYFVHLGKAKVASETNEKVNQSVQALFEQCVKDMKLSTRRYAKIQMKWIKNRFIKSKNIKSQYSSCKIFSFL
jgi:tRNA dimethylallyltransferase